MSYKFIIFLLIIPFFSFANNSFVNTFKITELKNKSGIIIECLVNKVIKKTIRKTFPSLKNNNYDNLIKMYLELNIVLKDENGIPLNMYSIEFSDNLDSYKKDFHSFNLFFEYDEIYSVTNTVSIDHSLNVINKHFFYTNDQKVEFITDSKNPTFYFKKDDQDQNDFKLIILFLIIIGIILFLFSLSKLYSKKT